MGTRDLWHRACVDPVFFSREFLEVEPHHGQLTWLQNSNRAENLLCTGNRWGKSQVQAIKLLHRCLFKIRPLRWDTTDHYSAVNVSITQDQAGIVFGKVVRLIQGRKRIESFVKNIRQTPFPHIEFVNGAVLWARSSQNRGEYLLGHDFDYVNFDEVAYEPHPEYVVEHVIMMRLADREGVIDFTSTPKGKNWFYRKFQEVKRNPLRGYVQTGDSRENPHISKQYLDWKIRTTSQARVQQNIYGMFVDDLERIIPEKDLQRSLGQAGGLSGPLPGHLYCHGWDLARKRTFTVGITLDITTKPYQLVALERFQRDWPYVYHRIRERFRSYRGLTLIDSTGLGDVVLSELKDIGARGFNFGEGGGRAKAELLANLEQAFVMGNVACPYVEQVLSDGTVWSLQEELRELNWENNSHCDAAMALALALWNIREHQDKIGIVAPRMARLAEV
jgi:hypothetical protein